MVPTLHFGIIVEPVFRKHGENIIVYHRLHPFVGAGFFRLSTEIAVPYAETLSQGLVS